MVQDSFRAKIADSLALYGDEDTDTPADMEWIKMAVLMKDVAVETLGLTKKKHVHLLNDN